MLPIRWTSPTAGCGSSAILAAAPARATTSHSAVCRPQPKAAIQMWVGFDLESRDLHPDDQVNHSDGAAMNGFVDLHGASVLHGGGRGKGAPIPSVNHATRTESGRPRS